MMGSRGSMAYVRWRYGVPAKRGARVEYLDTSDRGPVVRRSGNSPRVRTGTISYADNGRIWIKFDEPGSMPGSPRGPFHPTWNIVYLFPGGESPA